MKKTRNQKVDRPVQVCQPDIMRFIRFWTRQTLTDCGDKGGSFNVQLYLDYLEKIYKS